MTIYDAVTYLALFDVSLVLAFGFYLAFMFLTYDEKSREGMGEKVIPALVSIFFTSIVACLMLAALASFLGKGAQ